MDKQILAGPNYQKIFQDIIAHDFPNIKNECKNLLSKAKLNSQDVIKLNQKIFKGKSKDESNNPKFRSYDMQTISYVLAYQKKNGLNDTQLAFHFAISRNTIRSWRNKFL